MPLDDAEPAREPDEPRRERDPSAGAVSDSLLFEIRAAADAAISQVRTVAATASTEARINVASAIWMASAMMLIVALLISAWACVVGIGVWLAIEAGWSVTASLALAALANLVAAVLCRSWYVRMSRNLGFARTISLLFGPPDRHHVHEPLQESSHEPSP